MAHGPYMAGQMALEVVHLKGVVNSHPTMPIFMYYLGLLPMALPRDLRGHRGAKGQVCSALSGKEAAPGG